MSSRIESPANPHPPGYRPPMELTDGSRVGVVGGGPAGSLLAYFLLDLAERAGLDLRVDIYEPKDFARQGAGGCNMCGGIISESLVQNLAAEGILLPGSVVQRGIGSYTLHMDVGSVRIETPLQEKRIGAVHRGGGPRGEGTRRWESFDGFLLGLAAGKGARVLRQRVEAVDFDDGRPRIHADGAMPEPYDLLAVAVGVNGASQRLLEQLKPAAEVPRTTKTYIREFFLGWDTIEETLGESMQVFLLAIPRLEFAAVIPKGDYASLCLLGEEIDDGLLQRFLAAPEVEGCMPAGWVASEQACKCSPRIAVRGAVRPFADRLVFVGDAGVTRLYKDGIGAAYRTAKAAATAAVFEGVSADAFARVYGPACRRLTVDNAIGKFIFAFTGAIRANRLARRTVLRMVRREQSLPGRSRRMSTVLWDMFTGSAPYSEILLRTLHPAFWGRLLWAFATVLVTRDPTGPPPRRRAPRAPTAAF
jgi:flavin-dependent dehydrogenase